MKDTVTCHKSKLIIFSSRQQQGWCWLLSEEVSGVEVRTINSHTQNNIIIIMPHYREPMPKQPL